MSTAIVPASSELLRSPRVPWRDPHTVSPAELSRYIQMLEAACRHDPASVNLRTCLGMAYAMNYEVYKSMDALQAATSMDPEHFWAQLKYSELLYRLRALSRSEQETMKALDLARNPWELFLARKQLQEIRRLSREGARNVAWTKPLTIPALIFCMMVLMTFAAMAWK